ncbi:IPT/TIG domain-containing protein [Streptomyces sp. NBC_00154]|uniref:IPT/TIG domain-containing protein n=1 Tax=Streptomyces sp. NBC_00154 TaxID=2975670 RepID=UPI00224F8F7E|nr:IPT/TIG domain-containing protein [Streptomyces sp. NBC_00154]MCX5314443.1 IPT/TIG domain-containing protein [Streptomyces sp. NBC_00154]
MAPLVTSLDPNKGPIAGGTAVTINGSGFTGVTAVRFGTAPASFTVISTTQIIATSPAGFGTVNVTVVAAAGTSNGFAYSYVAIPALSSLTPGRGPTSGGNTVTLTGTNLSAATSVQFDTSSAVITGNSATQIIVTAPTAPAAPADVSVTTAGGVSNPLPYFYIPAPTVSLLGPGKGPLSGGNTVTITGTNLTLTSTVRFGAAAATGVTVDSDSQVFANAPSGSGSVTVTVTTPGGTSTPGLGTAYYTYLAVPAVSSLNPSSGPALGGTTVTLTGSGLTYADEVRFGSVPVPFTAVSDTQIIAVAPGGAPGTVTVVVRTPAGTASGIPYQYVT